MSVVEVRREEKQIKGKVTEETGDLFDEEEMGADGKNEHKEVKVQERVIKIEREFVTPK